jgi:hypothetical protein
MPAQKGTDQIIAARFDLTKISSSVATWSRTAQMAG